jgi:homoserine O-succinyltransferase
MSITLPQGLPAARRLRQEGIEVLGPAAVSGSNTRPLKIALVNLMPKKADAEMQIARLLGATAHAVELTLVIPDGYRPKTAPAAHIAAFYQRWGAVRERDFDGLIVTGAPIETLPFEEVSYWDQMTEILDWAAARGCPAYYICWAAQAALYHYHGVPKHALAEKAFGVYRHRVRAREAALLRGFGADFPVPVSRHTEVRAADLPRGRGLEVLAESDAAGLCLIADPKRAATYMFNHLEYDADSLAAEYRRDLEAAAAVPPPHGYFPDDDPARAPENRWRPFGHLLLRNWLDGVAEAARRRQAGDRDVDWLLAERRGPIPAGQGASDFLISGGPGATALPEVLRRLAGFGLSPLAVKVHGAGRAQGAIELRTDALPEARVQRIARGLLEAA